MSASSRASSGASRSTQTGRGAPTLFEPLSDGLRGRVRVPGDKSISHRAIILGGVSAGPVAVSGFLRSADTLATVDAMRALGVVVEEHGDGSLLVHGRGWEGLDEPGDVIDVKNAGTLMRLLPGILAACSFLTVLTGDASIRRRPMARVLDPLAEMGASVWGRDGGRLPPIALRGGSLRAISHRMEVASAQVKSCILLAGLRAEGVTEVWEPGPTRDHTERMVRYGGGRILRDADRRGPGTVRVWPVGSLELHSIDVPGDVSSAAFLMVAGLLVAGSDLVIEGVGLNPTRTGVLAVLERMNADLVVERLDESGVEPVGDVRVRSSELVATDVGPDEVPLMIDELPVWALAAARARGVSRLRGAGELRVKESDRLSATVALIRSLGVTVCEQDDGLDIVGMPQGWEGDVVVAARDDHRMAMVGAVAGFASGQGVAVDDVACIGVSFPSFADTIRRAAGNKEE